MNQASPICLSLDELAQALVMAGKPSVAKGLMTNTLGQISDDEIKGRLMSAGDSLIAKGLVVLSPDEAAMKLDDGLTSMLDIMGEPSFSVRLNKAGKLKGEENRTYYFSDDSIVRHVLSDVVINQLNPLNKEDFSKSAMGFFDLSSLRSTDSPVASISYEALEMARMPLSSQLDDLKNHFRQAGIEEPTLSAFSIDYFSGLLRGTSMRIDYHEDEVVCNKAFMLIRGEERAWVLKPYMTNTTRMIDVIPFSIEEFNKQLGGLLVD